MISDTSSIIYEYLITKKPIIIANNNYGDLHNMPDEMNILKVAKRYDGDDISGMINEALSENSQPKYEQLLNNCFYYNDGKSAQEQLISSFHLNIRNSYYAQKAPIFRRFDHQYIELEKKYKDI